MKMNFGFDVMSFDEFFEIYINTDTEFKKDELLTKYAKANGYSKRAVLGDIKSKIAYLKEQNKRKKVKEFFGTDGIEIPSGYDLIEFNNSVYLVQEMKDDVLYLCKMFAVTKKVVGKRAFLEIKFYNGKKEIILITDLLDTKILSRIFAEKGEVLDTKKASSIVRYISEFMRLNEDKIGYVYGVDEIGWNDDKKDFLIPSIKKNDVIWIDNTLENRFELSGSLNKQLDLVKRVADKKIFSVVLFSLSSPLIKLLNIKMNYLFHIGGLTGSGKSLACKLGVSVWGEPRIENYGANWNATLNGLESYLEKMKDVPSWIDEMELAKDWNLIVQLIYMFAEGRNKARAYVKDGEILEREHKTFRGVLFTSAEKNIDEIINNSKGRNKPLGLNRRVLSYESDYLWSDSGDEYKRLIGDVIDENWGYLGVWWIEKLKELGKEKIRYFWKLTKEENKIEKLDGKENIYYLMLTTLSILAHFNIVDYDKFEMQKSLIMLKADIDYKEHLKITNIVDSFIDEMRDFVLSKKSNFIKNADEYEELKGELYGVLENNRVWLVKKVFDNFCRENGYVKRQVLNELEKKGYLITDKNRKDKRFISDWGFGRPCFYCIVLPLEI